MSSFGFVFIRNGELKVSYAKSIASVRKPGKEVIVLEVFSVPEQFSGDSHYKRLLGHQKLTEHRLKTGDLSLPRVHSRKKRIGFQKKRKGEKNSVQVLPVISEDERGDEVAPSAATESGKKKFEIVIQDPIEVSYYSESDFDSDSRESEESGESGDESGDEEG